MNDTLLIPTNNLYASPNFADFKDSTQALLANQINGYAAKSVAEKWRCIMSAFANSNTLSAGDKASFKAFTADRLQTDSVNRYVLTMAQALIYFEGFYFLYHAAESNFALSPQQKIKLIEEIVVGMSPDVCEPGKFTHFENTLQRSRKDMNHWVLSELSKQRTTLIQTMAEQYNTTYNISNAYSIHTVMQMNRLARKRGLGVAQTTEVQDVYLSTHRVTAITNYFNNVSVKQFDNYECQAAANLSYHVLLQITDWLHSLNVDTSQWDNASLAFFDTTRKQYLSASEQADLSKILDTTLSLADGELAEFFDFDDDNNMVLRPKQRLLKVIESKVQRKLVADGFFVPLADISNDNPQLSQLRLPAGTSPATLVQLMSAAEDNQAHPVDVHGLVQANIQLINKYPKILAHLLLQTPLLWQDLSRSLKTNVNILDKLVAELNGMLLTDEGVCEKTFNLLLTITKSQPALLRQLSPNVLSSPAFALKLVSANGLLLEVLPEKLRRDAPIFEAAIAQNSQADIFVKTKEQESRLTNELRTTVFTLPVALARKFQSELTDTLAPSEDDHKKKSLAALYKKITAMKLLLEAKTLSTGRVIQLAQTLSPQEFMLIIEARKCKQLSPLPYGRKDALDNFIGALGDEASKTDDYLAVKRRLSETGPSLLKRRIPVHTDTNKLAYDSVLAHNYWYLAYIAYQKKLPVYNIGFNTLQDVVEQVKLSLKILSAAIVLLFNGLKRVISNLALPAVLYLSYLYLEPLQNALIIKATAYLLANVGMILPFVVPALGVAYLFSRRWSMSILGTALLMGAFATISLLAPEIILLVSSFCVAQLPLNVFLMLGSRFTAAPLNWREANLISANAIISYLWADVILFVKVVGVIIGMLKDIAAMAQMMFEAIAPWFTRGFASLLNAGEVTSKDENLIQRVEENIIRLQVSDEPSANQKGALLESLWEKVQARGGELAQGLTEKMPVAGYAEPLSFKDVAKTVRSDKTCFAATAPDTRFSFFGLRGKTTIAREIEPLMSTSMPCA